MKPAFKQDNIKIKIWCALKLHPDHHFEMIKSFNDFYSFVTAEQLW